MHQTYAKLINCCSFDTRMICRYDVTHEKQINDYAWFLTLSYGDGKDVGVANGNGRSVFENTHIVDFWYCGDGFNNQKEFYF